MKVWVFWCVGFYDFLGSSSCHEFTLEASGFNTPILLVKFHGPHFEGKEAAEKVCRLLL